MAVRFIGKDPPSKNGDSPSLWVDESDGSIVFQAYRVTNPEQVAGLLAASGRDHIPDHEVLGRLPATMLPLLQEVVDELRRRVPTAGPDSG
jgi:hypothetical protein